MARFKMFKVAFPVDGLLCDTESLKQEWASRLGDLKFLTDAAFWAALKPYGDVRQFGEYITEKGWDIYVFAERKKDLLLPTRAWLRNHAGLDMDVKRLVVPCLKRYDCRLLGIDVFIDSDIDAIENLKIETVHPIRTYHVDRANGGSLLDTARRINADFCGDA